jgi:two-component system response regulator (stage 0 sporulation protein A)
MQLNTETKMVEISLDDLRQLISTCNESTVTFSQIIKPVTEDKPNLDCQVSDILRDLGVPANIKGYRFLREAISLCVVKPDAINRVVKEIYPEVAWKFDTTPMRAERAIRHAIEVAFERGNIVKLQEIFGHTINSNKGKATNSEFIAMIADRLML